MSRVKFETITKVVLSEEQWDILCDAITIFHEIKDEVQNDLSIPHNLEMDSSSVAKHIADFMDEWCINYTNE